MFKLVVCLLLVAATKPIRVPAQWLAARAVLRSEMESRWKDRRQPAAEPGAPLWSPRLTPPLPAVWPPDGKGGYVVHAFAAAMRPSLHDGEEVAAPWIRFQLGGGALESRDLGTLRRLGMQGVRPLNAAEAEVARTADAAEQAVVALTKTTRSDPAPLVKRYYCQWASNNAVIGAELKRLHAGFFTALGCGP